MYTVHALSRYDMCCEGRGKERFGFRLLESEECLTASLATRDTLELGNARYATEAPRRFAGHRYT